MKSPGAAIALVYKGEIILLKGYGVKKAGEPDSVNHHTAFRLGSVSKGFASVLTGIMVEEGSLNWDDRVKSYLDDFKMKDTASENHLTVRHILSHTTGFPEHTYTDILDNGYEYEIIILGVVTCCFQRRRENSKVGTRGWLRAAIITAAMITAAMITAAIITPASRKILLRLFTANS